MSLNRQLSDGNMDKTIKEMKAIWYLLKCPEGDEADYTEKCRRAAVSETWKEVVCFKYQRMMRYGGKWHVEDRILLPGCIFLSGTKMTEEESPENAEALEEGRRSVLDLLIPCDIPYVRNMCREGNLIGMSRGIIRDGRPIVFGGPLKGRESLIRKIDRHKRTARIEIPLGGEQRQVTVGLEIYEKQSL